MLVQSTGTGVVLVLPGGAQVGVTGSAQSGFTPVRYNGTDGWAYFDLSERFCARHLCTTFLRNRHRNPLCHQQSQPPLGAGASFGVQTVIPSGAAVGITGNQSNGYFPGPLQRHGRVRCGLLPEYHTTRKRDPATILGSVIETRYATSNLNFRSGAGISFGVLGVIPSGGEVGITGNQSNGYFPGPLQRHQRLRRCELPEHLLAGKHHAATAILRDR